MRKLFIALTALCLSACTTLPKLGAAQDVHEFLLAVRDGDRAGFEAHVDRPALKAQLRSRALAEAPALLGQRELDVLGVLAAGPLVDLAVDALAQPDVFRAIAIRLGYSPTQPIPNALLIARELRDLPGDRVCVVEADRCTLVFAKVEGVWKLVAYEGDLGRLSSRIVRPRA